MGFWADGVEPPAALSNQMEFFSRTKRDGGETSLGVEVQAPRYQLLAKYSALSISCPLPPQHTMPSTILPVTINYMTLFKLWLVLYCCQAT